ncbi:DciA family protein [Streptomyces sp. bgisy091]|uniref:DciA family protein n=1 Tax=Streptomyces sp. bgisy091 TaxID=3413778 RepID=UPI003D70D44E
MPSAQPRPQQSRLLSPSAEQAQRHRVAPWAALAGIPCPSVPRSAGWSQNAAGSWPQPGGSILEQWPTIAPALAGNVTAVHFNPETRTLHLQPATPAHRTQLNLHQRDIVAKTNQVVGPDTVRHREILTSAALSSREYPAARVPATATPRRAMSEPPVKTRSDASTGYQRVLEQALRAAPWQERVAALQVVDNETGVSGEQPSDLLAVSGRQDTSGRRLFGR